MITILQLFLGFALVVAGGEMLLDTGSVIGGLGALLGVILVLKAVMRGLASPGRPRGK